MVTVNNQKTHKLSDDRYKEAEGDFNINWLGLIIFSR